MTVFTVHEPADRPAGTEAAADRVLFVKEGMCWPALIIPVLWLLYHRMWLALILYLVVSFGLAALTGWLGVGDLGAALATGAFALLFALEANELRRRVLARRGFRLAGVVAGADRDECERKFFTAWLDRPAPQPAAPASPLRQAMFDQRPQPPGIIGSFPEPEGGR